MITLAALLLTAPVLVASNLISQESGAGQAQQPSAPAKVVIGYVQDGDDTPDVASQVDYSKVTHLNVAFANPTGADGNLSVPPHLQQLVEQAHKNGVKISISIGGGGESENKNRRELLFSLIHDANRAAFVGKLTQYVLDNNLDGLDVDIEGPAINSDYGALVGDLSNGLKSKGKLLSAAVSVGYGGDQIKNETLGLFDFVNVMAYDATGPWSPDKPGQHSSMDLAKECVGYWFARGVPKQKIVLGVPFYGYGFGDAFTKDGYTYAQIVDKFPGAEQLDQVGKTVWYNGIPTIRAKTKYVLDQNLAGVMIWSLNQDAKGKLSLLAAIHDAIGGK